MSASTISGIVLLALSALGLWAEPRMFFAAWLAAWWWCLGLVLGCFVNGWMHVLTGGAWGQAIRPVARALGARMLWLLLAAAPLIAGLNLLYPWAAQPKGEWLHGVARPGFAVVWLSPAFFVARLVAYALVWWWLTRAAALAGKGRAAASLIVYSLVTSLAAVDLLMSLAPGWYSTAFGLVVLSTQALGGSALAVLLIARVAPQRIEPAAPGQPPVWRDLGNLLLMWSMSWGYLAFMQFIVIWAENLPREISWYLPRLQTGWSMVGVAVVLAQLALPFLALLFRRIKDRPRRLAKVAWLLLAASALDVTWLVLPSVAPHSMNGWWLVPLTTAGLALLLFGGVPAALREGRPESSTEGLQHARS